MRSYPVLPTILLIMLSLTACDIVPEQARFTQWDKASKKRPSLVLNFDETRKTNKQHFSQKELQNLSLRNAPPYCFKTQSCEKARSFATNAVALNVRQGPSTQYDIKTVLPKESFMGVHYCDKLWCYVSSINGTGWVFQKYLTLSKLTKKHRALM